MNHDTNGPHDGVAVDPVCGMTVDPATAAASRAHEGNTYFFCSDYCAEEFDADPRKFTNS